MEGKDWCDGNCNLCAKHIFEKCSDREYDIDSEEMFGELTEETEEDDD